jgi:hypothetical protein
MTRYAKMVIARLMLRNERRMVGLYLNHFYAE